MCLPTAESLQQANTDKNVWYNYYTKMKQNWIKLKQNETKT
jgi:hypothetical protein